MLISFGLIYALADMHLSRSILLGGGGALIGFVIGIYSMNFITNWWSSASLSLSTASTLQMAAAKATVNYFGSSGIKQVACVLEVASWFDVAFSIATGVLGAVAFGMGASEG